MENTARSSGCGGCLVVILFNFLFGGFLSDYCLWSIIGVNIHWFGDILIGLVAGEVLLPIAIVCFILRLFGVQAPFVGG
jgi:hypothetical protein